MKPLMRYFFKGSLLASTLMQLMSCNSGKKEFVEAEKLAHQYCQSCHVFTAPNSLDKKTWINSVLPAMGPRLGIQAANGIPYNYNAPKGSLPNEAAMSQADWEKIVRYFYSLAPDTLVRKTLKVISKKLIQFSYKATTYRNSKSPVTTVVKIDPLNQSIYVCDGAEFSIKIFDKGLNFRGEVGTHLAISSITLDSIISQNRHATLLTMGILNPNDVVSGGLQKLIVSTELLPTIEKIKNVDSLKRPVFFQHKDLDQDGKKDFLISEFGNFYGDLMWLKSTSDNNFEKIILRSQPGAMQTMLTDYNSDGKEDILALMAQGDEGLFLYENKGSGIYQERNLLRFSPVYGSTSFDLADFNSDGFLDIVYTSGDNSDYSRILKPYHGVYIFLNDGHWNFGKEDYFFPINGCFKVIARDFDQDGDVDLSTISFFADLRNTPEEGFVYLKNEGDLKFEPQTFPEVMEGHWLTMDAEDLDSDGDLDIVLGNMSVGPTNIRTENNWKLGPPFVLLENKLK